MASTSNILVVSADPKLHAEIRSALAALAERAPVAYFVNELREGVEAARNRGPDLVVVEMADNVAALKMFAQEMDAVAPGTTIAAVFRQDAFPPDVSESAVLIEALRAGVKDFLRRPVSTGELDQLLRRSHRDEQSVNSRLGKVVSFVSNKGGVGKSTLSVNVACGLAMRRPERVLLIDASLQLGVAASMLDARPLTTLTDAVRERRRLDETFLRQLATPHPSGLHLLAAPQDAMEAAEVDDEAMARVINLARRAYDLVIVDSFPIFDRVLISILDLSDRIYLVTEGVVPTLLGAAKLVALMAGLGYPAEKQRMVLNRYSPVPGGVKPEDVAARLGRDVDFVLPYDTQVMVAANNGRPYAMNPSRWRGFGPPFARLVQDVETVLQ